MNQTQIKRRGRPSKKKVAQNVTYTPSLIDFSAITKLNNLNVDPKMMETMKSGLALDHFVSYEGGVPSASNMMIIGDPGVGKTTLLLVVSDGPFTVKSTNPTWVIAPTPTLLANPPPVLY